MNGPANTLHISEGGINIDVDLVPVIQFPSTIRPPVTVRWNEEMVIFSLKMCTESVFLFKNNES